MYKSIGELVMRVDERNSSGIENLLGVSINKCFMPSVANTIGTDLSNYKVIRMNDFAVSLMQVSRDSKIPIACYKDNNEAIMSPAYSIFRVQNENVVLPDYLDMWFKRPEFDRECSFIAVGGVRGSMPWEEFARIKVLVPDMNEQKKLVRNYKIIADRIALKQKINDNLAKTLNVYLQDFVANCSLENAVKLKDLCTMQYGYTETATSQPIGPKFLRITDIAKVSLNWDSVPYCPISTSEYEKYVLHEGDILVARTGATVGVARMIGKYIPNAVFASFLVRIRALNMDLRYYLGLLITSDDFLQFVQNNAGGSAQPQANPPLLGEFQVLLPDKLALVRFNSIVVPFLRMIENNEIDISQLMRIKDTIISMISRR